MEDSTFWICTGTFLFVIIFIVLIYGLTSWSESRREQLIQSCTENHGELIQNENGTYACHYPQGTALSSTIPLM